MTASNNISLDQNPDSQPRVAIPSRLLAIEILKRIPGSLQLKISILILLPVMIILTLAIAIEYGRNRERHLNIMSNLAAQTGQVIEETLQRDMLISDFKEIQTAIDALGSDEQIRTLYILDPQGSIVFAPSGAGEREALNPQDEACQGCHRLPAGERPSGAVVTRSDGQRVFRSMHPIENRPECTRCHDPEDRILGLLLSDQSIAPVEKALSLALRDNVIIWIGAVLATAFLSNVAVFQFIVQRLRELAAAMESFGSGKLKGQLPEAPKDEIGRLGKVFNRMSARIMERDRENISLTKALDTRISERGELLKRLLTIQEVERKHLAREIHDEIGQGLSSIALSIELSERSLEVNPSASKEYLQQASTMIADSTDRMYDLILGLRPSALDDLGLISALRAHLQRTMEPAGINFEFDTTDIKERLPAEIETTLFRLFQEALTNVVRHSKAKNVSLRITIENGHIYGEIVDDGVGFDMEKLTTTRLGERGFGILGMQERVDQFNGELEIQSSRNGGTRLQIKLPITGNGDE
jgi:signal transduction histidine kinase